MQLAGRTPSPRYCWPFPLGTPMSAEPIVTYTMPWPNGEVISGDWLSVVRPQHVPIIRCVIHGRGSSLEVRIGDCAMWIDCETAADLEPIVSELQARVAMLSPGIGRSE